ncbi:hypothetical protein MKX03_002463, partial [Papaver bracteatum]
MEKKKQLPQDEHRCTQSDGLGWRCKNFRMNHGAAADDDTLPKTRYCEKHYNYLSKYNKILKEKRRSGDGEETTGSKRRRSKKVTEEEDDDT